MFCCGAMRMIEEHGTGVLVALHAAAPGSLSRSLDLRAGKPDEAGDAVRGYGTGAQILAALGIHDMILLTNTHHSPIALSGYGLAIVEERAIDKGDHPARRGAVLPASQRHAACRRAGGDRGGGTQA